MTQMNDEAITAVSASISAATDGDLLTAVHAAEQKWQAQLDEAKTTARTLLATVLSEREALRTSLGTAAELWRTLRPSEQNASPAQLAVGTECNLPPSFLADEEQLSVVKALQNVSHTLFLAEFIISAPEALQRAHSSLVKIKKDGLDKMVAGNAAQLVEAHAILTAGERLRNLVLLEAPEQFSDELSPMQGFSSAREIRDLLEEIVLRGVFSRIVEISQQNPRLLVAAARVIESEEREDIWWRSYLVRYDDPALNSVVRSCGAQMYKERALKAIVTSLQAQFRQKEQDLGLHEDSAKEGVDCAQPCSSAQVSLNGILDWIRYRRSENETVRRFVVPCLPPSFAVSELFEQELHREFMRIVTLVLHLATPDGSMLLSEADLIQLTSWYSSYKEEVGDQNEDIDSFLDEEDRERLISALQKHCASRISSKISSTFAADMEESSVSQDPANQAETDGTTASRLGHALRRTDLPDIVLGCVNDEVKRILALKIKGLDHAIAQTAAECLTSFQEEVQQTLCVFSDTEQEENYLLHACTTANNMARCLDLSEYLRGLFVPLAGDQDRSDIEDKMDSVIEGFRSTSSRALHVLVNGITSNIESLASRFFAPHTGTEIMLDIVATLDDYFSDYEVFLLEYHFEHLAIESLKRIVVWYLAPFLRLSNHRVEESAARRFTSLPTFGEMNLRGTRSELYEENLFTMRSENEGREKAKSDGLSGMNGAAVVAQIDKDISNLTTFMEKKVVSFQRKQLQPVLEPLHAIRAMYTCPVTPFSLAETFRDVSSIIGRVLRPSWVLECGLEGRFNARVAEVIWGCRTDLNPVVRLEAVNTIRATAERMESTSQSRMSSFDDGRVWGSRNSDFGGPSSERLFRKDARSSDYAGSSSSLLWAPSLSKSPRSRSRRQ